MPFTKANAAQWGTVGGLNRFAAHGSELAKAVAKAGQAGLRAKTRDRIIAQVGSEPADIERRVSRAMKGHMKSLRNYAVQGMHAELKRREQLAAQIDQAARNGSIAELQRLAHALLKEGQ